MTKKIGIIGFGSIGGTVAEAYRRLGYDVYGNDIKQKIVENKGFKYLDKGNMGTKCDIIFICVPTPTDIDGCDTELVDRCLDELEKSKATVVIRSTVGPGTTDKLSEKHNLNLVHMPEMLRDEWGVEEALDPDRLVFAGPIEERKEVVNIHQDLNTQILEYDNPVVAEVGKYAHNAFFATKVSFANQIRLYANNLGVDPSDVMDIVTADFRNSEYHMDPTMGPFGGKCLPKDLAALVATGKSNDIPHQLFEGVFKINDITKQELGSNTPSQGIQEYDPSIHQDLE